MDKKWRLYLGLNHGFRVFAFRILTRKFDPRPPDDKGKITSGPPDDEGRGGGAKITSWSRWRRLRVTPPLSCMDALSYVVGNYCEWDFHYVTRTSIVRLLHWIVLLTILRSELCRGTWQSWKGIWFWNFWMGLWMQSPKDTKPRGHKCKDTKSHKDAKCIDTKSHKDAKCKDAKFLSDAKV